MNLKTRASSLTKQRPTEGELDFLPTEGDGLRKANFSACGRRGLRKAKFRTFQPTEGGPTEGSSNLKFLEVSKLRSIFQNRKIRLFRRAGKGSLDVAGEEGMYTVREQHAEAK